MLNTFAIQTNVNFGDTSFNDYLSVSAEMGSDTPVIEKYAKEYKISKYVAHVLRYKRGYVISIVKD